MKNKILTILFAVIISYANAQTEQGTKMIGGNAGFSFTGDKTKTGRTTVDGYKTASFNLDPNVGYFIIDNFAIGAQVSIALQTSSLKDGLYVSPTRRENSRNSYTSLALGPWARYYFPVGTKSAFFGEANTSLGIARNKYKDVENGRVVTEKSPAYGVFQLGVGPGYTYFITPNVGIEGLLQYRVDRTSYKPENADNRTKETTAGLYFNVGLQIYIP